jgi:hypothetical protein
VRVQGFEQGGTKNVERLPTRLRKATASAAESMFSNVVLGRTTHRSPFSVSLTPSEAAVLLVQEKNIRSLVIDLGHDSDKAFVREVQMRHGRRGSFLPREAT